MGDMADMALDQMADPDEHGIDGFCPYFINEYGDLEGTTANSRVCRCYGYGGLHWEKVGEKWRLFDVDRKIHNCPVNKLNEIHP